MNRFVNKQPHDHTPAAPHWWQRGPDGVAWLFLALLLGLALLVRLYRLDAQSLWLDEGSTWRIIQASWRTLFDDLQSQAAAYPLYHLLLKGWVALADDSEWALRLPSALAGALAVLALYATAHELQHHLPTERQNRAFPLAAAVLLAFAPFALWYAQEAKVYSLLLLVVVLLMWALLRAVRHGTWQAWLLFVVLALLSVFVHRLAALVLVAAGCAALAYYSDRRHLALRVGLGGVLLAVSIAIVREMQRGLGGDFATIAEAGAYIPAGPPFALWLTLLRFSFDRGPGEFASWWLLPWLALSVGGGLWLLRDSLRPTSNGGGAARALACFGLVPLVLFLAQLATTRLYEARYLIIVYPAWLLLLAYPLTALPRLPRIAHSAVIAGALLVCLVALAQPPRGLFSGYPVKEQYREAVRVLAERVHPDDLIVLHPSYIEPLYDYYMQRFSADPAPQPVLFEAFKHRQTAFNQRDWDEARRRYFAGYVRSFLLIAPNHARTVDRPPTAVDEYGLVGLYYQYSREQQKWPCGIWRFNGAHLLCQDSPEAYETGTIPEPATPIRATFGETIAFFGYTLKATTPNGPGTYRAGGTLPITLFWDVHAPPPADYSVFLHLCQNCTIPPAASEDAPPMDGYLPTSTWIPGNLVHDERGIALPADLPPGQYQLLVGMYNPGDPTTTARLPITSAYPVDTNRLLLGTVEIVAAAQ
ncbi:MAG: DUF2723 domain-containing protein [Chloroflexaceae bacterium]|nr:DUF2723 domain-containing protein [Chloroflexaceae bacterium]